MSSRASVIAFEGRPSKFQAVIAIQRALTLSLSPYSAEFSSCSVRHPFRLLSVLSLVVAMLTWSGCQPGSSGAKGVKVTGKITYKGNPVKEGRVGFYNSETSTGGMALIKEDGTFETSQPLPPGTYTVAISPPLEEKDDKRLTSYQAPKQMPDIPQKYRSSTTSGLKYEVSATAAPLEVDMK